MALLRSAHPVARRPHHCQECGRTIDAGERHSVAVFADGGAIQTWRACEHCHTARLVIAARCPAFTDVFYGGLPEHHRFAEDALDAMEIPMLLRLEVGFRARWCRYDGARWPLPNIARCEQLVTVRDDGTCIREWVPSIGGYGIHCETCGRHGPYDRFEQAEQAQLRHGATARIIAWHDTDCTVAA